MAGLDELTRGLTRALTVALDGAGAGLDDYGDQVTTRMQQNAPWTDQTGSARDSLIAYRVGRGETGADAFEAARAKAEAFNPGSTESAPVQVQSELGMVFTDATTHAVFLEREHAGRDAVLTPTVMAEGLNCTAAAAAGARKAWGG
jgi:hypothetical protein